MQENSNEQVLFGIKLNLDSSQAESSTDVLNTSIDKLKKQLKDSSDRVTKLVSKGDDLGESYEAAVNEVAKLNSEFEALVANNKHVSPSTIEQLSIAAKKSEKEIGKLESKVKDLSLQNQNIFSNEAYSKVKSTLESIGSQFGILGQIAGATLAEISKSAGNLGNTLTSTRSIISRVTTGWKGLNIVMKASIIGLIVSALAALVSNWDKVTAKVQQVIPAFTKMNGIFDTTIDVLKGVGNAILQYLAAPINSVINLIQGDFQGAINSFKNGFNVVANYQSSVLESQLSRQKEYQHKLLKGEIESTEQRLSIARAMGKETEKIERQLFQLKLKYNKDNKEEYLKVVQEMNLFEAGQIKTANERRKAALKSASDVYKAVLEQLKQYNAEAIKVIESQNKTAMTLEIKAVEDNYKDRIALARKHKQDSSQIVAAQELEITSIRKKYADEVNTYIKGLSDSQLNSFDQRRKQIKEEIERLKKDATDTQKELLDNALNTQVDIINREEKLTLESRKTSVIQETTTINNQVIESDTPEEAYTKIMAVHNARMSAESAAFELRKEKARNDKEELENLEQEHQNNMLSIANDTASAQQAIDTRVKEHKMAELEAISSALGAASGAFSENVALSKILSSAQAVMSTYSGASQVLGDPALIGQPWTRAVMAGSIIAQGLSNVAAINRVQVPNSQMTTPTPVATAPRIPIINSRTLASANQPTATVQDVKVINNNNSQFPETINAIISNNDLHKQKQKDDRNRNLKSY